MSQCDGAPTANRNRQVTRSSTWRVLLIAIACHPLFLYGRALRRGFSDSGLLGGTLSFLLAGTVFSLVLMLMFMPTADALREIGRLNQGALGLLAVAIVLAHVGVAVGISLTGSNWFGLIYPTLAAVVLVATKTMPPKSRTNRSPPMPPPRGRRPRRRERPATAGGHRHTSGRGASRAVTNPSGDLGPWPICL